MGNKVCLIFCVLLLMVVGMSVAYGLPSYRGYTGLMIVPTADALNKGEWNAGLFWEDVAEGSINDYIANYGVIDGLEVGFNKFQKDKVFVNGTTRDVSSRTFINAKYRFIGNAYTPLSVAGGISDLTDDLDTTVYIVGSQILGRCPNVYRGEVLNPRIHVGFGGGILSGLFAGGSVYVGNSLKLMAEWDSRSVQAGLAFRVTPEFTVHAGVFDITDRDDNISVGVGASFSRYY